MLIAIIQGFIGFLRIFMKKRIYFNQDRNFLALIYLLLSILVASVAAGINVISFPAVLIKNDVTPFLIGLSATNEILFGIFVMFILSRIVAFFNALNTTLIISVFYTGIICVISFYQNYYLWILLSGLGGACWLSLFIIRQSWLNSIIADENRSVILALTTTIFCLGFASGSFFVKNFGAEDYRTFLTSAGLILLSSTLLLLIRNSQPKKIDSQKIKIKDFYKKTPRAAVAGFLLDFQAACIICLGVVFGTKAGYSVENSGFLIGAFMASGLFDLYAGFLVKNFNRDNMVLYGFLGCVSSMTTGFILHEYYTVMLIAFFIFGCSCALIIVSTLTTVNESYEKSKLVAANSTFQAIGSIGGVSGCFIGGMAIEFFDFYGFFAIIILAGISYLGYEIKTRLNN